ncbi:hypothetical protein AAFF_G00254270 [Aldrovandia affinis]|uniref:Uncharacterized protein n=1 Tax=Aldrovandia affinis TaxID=143900 RepID=A0AAD7RCJ3_9TELE|nr:hypothetical protein AAFF_G00254270 [Aldrovandia affinis]
MRAEVSKMETEDTSTAMPVPGYSDSAYKTLSQDKPSLSIHNSPQGVQRECETTPTSGDCPELNPEDTGAPNEGRHDGSPQNSANGTINNDPSSPTPNGFGVMRADVSKMETEESSTAMPVPGFSDSGYNTLNQEKSSLSIHDSTQEDQRECETTPTSGDCPELDLEEAGPENEDWNQNKIVKLKKGPSRQVREKKMMLKNTDTLREWALKQIPSEKSGSSQEEELKKIKDAITIVNIKQHPSYPLLLAVNCKVFRDPQTHKCKIIEIPDPDQINKNGQLKEAVDFKVQFHMWLLDISETVVVLKDGNEKRVAKVLLKNLPNSISVISRRSSFLFLLSLTKFRGERSCSRLMPSWISMNCNPGHHWMLF